MTHVRNNNYSQAVAAELRAVMARRSLTQDWLASATGIRPSTLHRRYRGQEPFLISELGDIAEALGIDVRDLMPPLSGLAA